MKTRHTELKTERQWRSATGLTQAKFEYLANRFKIEYKNLFGKTKEENLAESPKSPRVKTEEDLLLLWNVKLAVIHRTAYIVMSH